MSTGYWSEEDELVMDYGRRQSPFPRIYPDPHHAYRSSRPHYERRGRHSPDYLVPAVSGGTIQRSRSTGHRMSAPGPAPVIINNRIVNEQLDDDDHRHLDRNLRDQLYLSAEHSRRRSRSRSHSHSRRSSRSSHGSSRDHHHDYEIERIRERARLEAQMQMQLETLRTKDSSGERERIRARREYEELLREREHQDRELELARDKTRREVESEMRYERERRERENDKISQKVKDQYERETAKSKQLRETAEAKKMKEELERFKQEKEREANERRVKEELEMKRMKEEKQRAEEAAKLKKEREIAIEEFKIKEAERLAKDKKAKEEVEKEIQQRLEAELRKSGVDERQIAIALKKEVPIERPTYTRMARRHLSIETLRVHRIDYEFDQDPEYILIKRWVPEEEQDRLWHHTRRIREHRMTTLVGIEGTRHNHGQVDYTWVKKTKKERKPSPSPLLTFLAGGSSRR